MKKALLVLVVLGTGVVQASSAAVNTISNSPLTYSRANISNSYGSSQNIYSTSNKAHISSNEEISEAIRILKQKGRNLEAWSRPSNSESFDEIKKWADQGSAKYQTKLGRIYSEGKGVRQDLVLARKLFQKAANQGYIESQIYLGNFHEFGKGGLRQSKSTAKEWYGKVCDKGDQYGCNEYRRLNEQGY